MVFNDIYELANHFSTLVDQLPYPDRVSLPDKPLRKNFSNNKSFGEALDDWEETEKEIKEVLREERRKYQTAVSNIESDFKKALLVHLGIQNHKMADKLYEMAWDRGHSSGYGEVAMEADRLAELLS